MTMPGKKSVLVGGKTYPYVLKFGSRRFSTLGETPRVVQLTFKLDDRKFVRTRFESKLWTREHEDDLLSKGVHKNTFGPKDVAAVIRGLVNGQVPSDFELDTWKVMTDHQRMR
jgi:hypothetical protein